MKLKALLPLAAFLAFGCVKEKVVIKLQPDGSGSMHVSRKVGGAIGKSLAALGKLQIALVPEAEREIEALASISKEYSGVSAWTKARQEFGEEEFVSEATAWFDDITKVVELDEKTGQSKRSFTMTKDEAGNVQFAVVFRNDKAEDFQGMSDEDKKAQVAMMKGMLEAMLKDIEMVTEVTVPGAISAHKGFQKAEGKTATLKIDFDALMALMEKGQEINSLGLEFKADGAARDEAFDAEYKKAKESWGAVKEKVEAKVLEKKKKEAAEDEENGGSDDEGGNEEDMGEEED